MNKYILMRTTILGTVGAGVLLGIYFGILTLISGWNFATDQFAQFWYFVVPLALGFGLQIGLYSYLKSVLRHAKTSGKVLAVSGATSTGAMISCCTHYLVNILPIIGVTGFVSVVAQYQVELFWVGLFFNLAGIIYIGKKVITLRNTYEQ